MAEIVARVGKGARNIDRLSLSGIGIAYLAFSVALKTISRTNAATI
jgi:hypothetical protein